MNVLDTGSAGATVVADGSPAFCEQPILQVRNLTRHYEVSQGLLRPKGIVRALNGVGFDLHRGKTLAVVGESGCGKSTLARQLTLIEQPSDGHIILDGVDVARARGAEHQALRRKVQMVFQNPYASLNPRQKIARQLEEPLVINTRQPATEREARVTEMLAVVGLRPEYAHRYPHMFSGGQRQRIAIARAMMLKPDILVADEPTSALDVSIQAQVLNLFMDLQQELQTAYVFISHNLAVVQHVADDVMVMYLGRAVETGPKKTIFSRPLHPYTSALLSASPSLHTRNRREVIRIQGEPPNPLHPPGGCAFHKRCPHAVEQCRQAIPELRLLEGRQVACHRAEAIG
ncbi:MAG: ABC transporter ATP-binding protein [Brachymonas sp.]|jgi:dipeptide transport system ATP-binding protein|nr:ABC transporter ATP-binding protein [Brachymonas sp.]